MYDLKIVVEEVRGFCDMPMNPGDYFEVKGGRIIIPEGKYMCMWALQSLIPMIPLKQRKIDEENDWVPHTKKICCPDPNGMVIYRIETVCEETKNSDKTNKVQNSNSKPRMLVDEKKCTGCRACETACSFKDSGSFSSINSRIRVEKDEQNGFDIPYVCRQCGNAQCVQTCPAGALSRHPETKAVIVDEEKCTGCRLCLKACPFDSIIFHSETGKAIFCDLCNGEPECVKRCAGKAIVFGNAGNLKD